MGKKTGKASWIPSLQKSPRLDAGKTPQCSPHIYCKPAAEEPSIDMNVNGQIRYSPWLARCLAEMEYHAAEPPSRLTMFG